MDINITREDAVNIIEQLGYYQSICERDKKTKEHEVDMANQREQELIAKWEYMAAREMFLEASFAHESVMILSQNIRECEYLIYMLQKKVGEEN